MKPPKRKSLPPPRTPQGWDTFQPNDIFNSRDELVEEMSRRYGEDYRVMNIWTDKATGLFCCRISIPEIKYRFEKKKKK